MRTYDAPQDGVRDRWGISIGNPFMEDDPAAEPLDILFVRNCSVVTSGDYQRAYTVDGKRYHHIIDPDTRMPSVYFRSVTVVCRDSALADALSTALFLLPLEEGRNLAEKCGADVLWVDHSGKEHMTQGFQSILRT